MERQEGNRALPSNGGKRGKVILIIIASVLAVLVLAYAVLCAYVASNEVLLPHTSVSGVDLGGLNRQQALEKLERELTPRYTALSAAFVCNGTEFNVSGRELTADLSEGIRGAWDANSGGLLTGGLRYLSALLGGVSVDVPLTFAQSPSAITQAEEHISNAMVESSWTLGDDALVMTKGITGQAIDTATLQQQLLERFHTMLTDSDPTGTQYAPIEVPVITEAPPEPDFEAIYQQVYRDVSDAYLDKETKQVMPSVTGISFDIAAARAMLERTEEGGECLVPLDKIAPKITTSKLEANLFKDVLGSSTTKCAGPSERRYNIDLAAKRVNDTILLPGETFSYNTLCGPYSTSSGYKKAGAYVGGKSIDTTAGGICQLSSTIYWTTLKANLKIVERNQHRYNSGYMPVIGTDATVYSDSLDFRFQNSTEYPIKVVAYQDKNHKLHVTIYGTDTTGIHGEPYSVTLSTVAYKNTYKPKADIPVGSAPQRDPEYARYNGVTVELYQKLVDKNGNTVSTTYLYKNTYKSSDAVYYYNPADAARLGINTSTGLMTEVPVATPSPTPTQTPVVTQTPTPVVTPTPGVSDPPTTQTPPIVPTPTPTAIPGDLPILPPEAETA